MRFLTATIPAPHSVENMNLDHTPLQLRPTTLTLTLTLTLDPAPPPAAPLTMERFLALRAAIAFARRIHEGQQRMSGCAFVSHPLAVLQILLSADTSLPREAYVAGLLHDALEDGQANSRELRSLFGKEVEAAVRALSRPEKPHSGFAPAGATPRFCLFDQSESRTDHEREYLAQMVLANELIPYVLLIKMADRLHNVETSHFLSPERSRALLSETATLYLPAFQAGEPRQKRFPEAYRTLLQLLETSVESRMRSTKVVGLPAKQEEQAAGSRSGNFL